MSMEFKVITPDEVAVAATVEYVYLPGSLGEMGVLEHHTALITSLEPGELRYKPMEMSREEQARFEANLTKQIMMLNFKRKHKSPGR